MKKILPILFGLLAVSTMQGQVELQQQFNGKFECYSQVKAGWTDCFWAHIKPYKDTCMISHKDHSLEIKILDGKRIRLSEVTDSCEEKSKILRYHLDQDTLVVRKIRNRWFMGVPPFFFATHAERLKLVMDGNNDLLLNYKGGAAGMLFLLTTGYHTEGTALYKRK
jgi:hypothetical protein